MADPHPRKGMPSVDYAAFRERFLELFYDPRFDDVRGEIEQSIKIAWQNLEDERKAPRTRKAGSGYVDPDYDPALFEETRNVARTVIQAVQRYRAGEKEPGSNLNDPRPK